MSTGPSRGRWRGVRAACSGAAAVITLSTWQPQRRWSLIHFRAWLSPTILRSTSPDANDVYVMAEMSITIGGDDVDRAQ